MQYYCHEGTIFQRCTLEKKVETATIPDLSLMELKADLLIRDLDFTRSKYFNTPYRTSDDYEFRITCDSHSLMIIHKSPTSSFLDSEIDGSGDSNDLFPEAIVFKITPVVNGTLQRLTVEDVTTYIKLSRKAQVRFKKFGILDVVLAYRLHVQDDEKVSTETQILILHLSEMKSKFSKTRRAPYQKNRLLTQPVPEFHHSVQPRAHPLGLLYSCRSTHSRHH